MLILEIVAGSGWFSWHDDEDGCQNEDYSNLRLTSRDVKTLVDSPIFGGPDFEVIAEFLNMKNGFDYHISQYGGFCNHCYSIRGDYEGEGCDCDTCAAADDYPYEYCTCEKSHRHGPVLLQLDPRLNPDINFHSLSPRERAMRLLKFLRKVAFNFLREYYENQVQVFEPELTSIDPDMFYRDICPFMNQLKEHNLPFYNFIHHLLFSGWAHYDSYTSPGTCSPYRGRFLGDGVNYNDGTESHKGSFHESTLCFIGLHKSDELKIIPPQHTVSDYSVSQIQHIPETIRRCVMNTVDQKAEALLGKCIADSIDLYRLVRETYDEREEALSQIQWMSCLGGVREEFVPLDDFQGYNLNMKEKTLMALVYYGSLRIISQPVFASCLIALVSYKHVWGLLLCFRKPLLEMANFHACNIRHIFKFHILK